jgi:molybdopterin synthase catalytic subunit
MRVNVLFFGLLKDLVGRSQDSLELPEGSRVGTVFDHYASEYPKLKEMAESIALARNQEFADADAALGEGDEVALMPPVSGGSRAKSANGAGWIASAEEEGSFYALTRDPIDTKTLVDRVLEGSDGAVLTFEGVVRNQTKGRKTRFLDYECYAPLALKTMQELGREILSEHPIHRLAMVHRLGRLEIREASVVIVVVSAHRQAAYEASLEAINSLKRRVPVWKKEYFEDGEVWVEGEWETSVPRPAGTPR